MALEQPFSHWPFGKQGQQNSQLLNGNARRYNTNDSPFKHISPIPTGGRDFGTFPMVDRQSKNSVREQLTQALNSRASQGFVPSLQPVQQTMFDPIQEDEVMSPEPVPSPRQAPRNYFDNEPPQEPRRGLSLMDRYGQGPTRGEPIRRTNSLVDFALFLDQAQRNGVRKVPFLTQQPMQTNVPKSRTTIPPRHQPDIVYSRDHIKVRQQPPRYIQPRKKSSIATPVGICLTIFGILVVAAFVAAFVALLLLRPDVWPTSGLLLGGVVVGLLLFATGGIFVCHRCLHSSQEDPYPSSFDRFDDIGRERIGDSGEWQTLDDGRGRQRPDPMTEYQSQPDPFSAEEFLEQDITPDTDVDNPRDIPNGGNSLPNGVPSQLTFTSLAKTTPNEYLY
ncbi:uncharacterized protein [Diadema setosum]|uniref:uncharacterized protein n=1 Tax=Diadema setosum TaxID=31175 RepID=UPI003B3AC90B